MPHTVAYDQKWIQLFNNPEVNPRQKEKATVEDFEQAT